jgi:hypothetical protein
VKKSQTAKKVRSCEVEVRLSEEKVRLCEEKEAILCDGLLKQPLAWLPKLTEKSNTLTLASKQELAAKPKEFLKTYYLTVKQEITKLRRRPGFIRGLGGITGA